MIDGSLYNLKQRVRGDTVMILIAGCNGHVGQEIVKKVAARGMKARCFDIRPLDLPGVDTSHLDIVTGDITDPEAVRAAMKDVDVVMCVIGIKDTTNVTHEMVEHGGMKNVIRAGKENNVKHIMYISSLGARQDSPAQSQAAKWRTEQTLQQSGITYTIFRPSGYFIDVTEYLVKEIKTKGKLSLIGDGQYRIQPVDPVDLAEAFIQSIDNEKAHNKIFKFAGPEIFTQLEMINLTAKVMDVAVKIKKLPYWLLNGMFSLIAFFTGKKALKDLLYRMTRHSSITEQEMAELHDAFTIESKRLEPWLREQIEQGKA